MNYNSDDDDEEDDGGCMGCGMGGKDEDSDEGGEGWRRKNMKPDQYYVTQ